MRRFFRKPEVRAFLDTLIVGAMVAVTLRLELGDPVYAFPMVIAYNTFILVYRGGD